MRFKCVLSYEELSDAIREYLFTEIGHEAYGPMKWTVNREPGDKKEVTVTFEHETVGNARIEKEEDS
jgi:hypothetical protein